MSAATDMASGKDHTGENFPVASWLVRPDARAPILTFYRFARAADDIADHPAATEREKLDLLGMMRAGLADSGAEDAAPDTAIEAVELARMARLRKLDLAHAHDLLDAFVQDVTVNRYADWDALIGYCRLSAMPVGRMVLDIHGEDRALWPMNDALCAALQVINHLQDCGKDYHALGRVYVPTDLLDAAGVPVSALGEARASPDLRGVIAGLAEQTLGLLREAAPFARGIRDARLAAEVAVIQRLAVDLAEGLTRRDPLSEPVHHGKLRAGRLALGAVLRHGVMRMRR
jgi:squalene synthase HpnC